MATILFSDDRLSPIAIQVGKCNFSKINEYCNYILLIDMGANLCADIYAQHCKLSKLILNQFEIFEQHRKFKKYANLFFTFGKPLFKVGNFEEDCEIDFATFSLLGFPKTVTQFCKIAEAISDTFVDVAPSAASDSNEIGHACGQN
jgi:hypothetical protein